MMRKVVECDMGEDSSIQVFQRFLHTLIVKRCVAEDGRTVSNNARRYHHDPRNGGSEQPKNGEEDCIDEKCSCFRGD